MPSSKKARQGIASLIPDSKAAIFELGSGWGHLAFSLSRHFPNAAIHAFEGSYLPWLVSVMGKQLLLRTNVRIKRKNFYSVSLQEAEGIVCYLYPGAMQKLKEKFEKELKPGTFIISHSFSIPGWIPEKELEINDLCRSRLYYYRVKCK